MWHALRAELAYFRVFLFSAWAIALGVGALLNVLTLLDSEDGPQSFVLGGLPGMFMIIAAMIVGFIAQGTRSEERRARLFLAGPLTPRQLAGVMVLLPTCFIGLGVLAAGLVIGAAYLITGKLEPSTLGIVGNVAGQMFAILQLGPLAQEASAARRQRRNTATVVGWILFSVSIGILTASQWDNAAIPVHLRHLVVAASAMLTSTALYIGRTDFSR